MHSKYTETHSQHTQTTVKTLLQHTENTQNIHKTFHKTCSEHTENIV